MAETSNMIPFPIFKVGPRYLLFDIDVISYIRREHNLGGVLIGNIPQASQQTLFSGIPLELMPEEVLLLLSKDITFIVDDVSAHDRMLAGLDELSKQKSKQRLDQDGLDAGKSWQSQAIDRKKAFLKKSGSTEAEMPTAQRMQVTPTTSYPPLEALSDPTSEPPELPKAYPVFAHLHENGYFMGPGLRFGCQYVAYPGDPLRYHSHFLVTGHEWDEGIELIDIVGGGRLGTGVKKGYMIGGAPEQKKDKDEPKVRVFSFEWAAM